MRALTGLGVYPICRALAPGKGTADVAVMGMGWVLEVGGRMKHLKILVQNSTCVDSATLREEFTGKD